jgi:hypothetical protein
MSDWLPGGGNQNDAAVAENVEVTIYQLEISWMPRQLASQGNQLVQIWIRRRTGVDPVVFGSLQ